MAKRGVILKKRLLPALPKSCFQNLVFLNPPPVIVASPDRAPIDETVFFWHKRRSGKFRKDFAFSVQTRLC